MTLKLKKLLTITAMALTMLVPAMVPASTYACNTIQSGVAGGIGTATNSTTTCGSGGDVKSGIGGIAKTVVNILSVVVGIVAIIMIIYAGFRYITSGGESGSVSSAKNSLIYAIVGLVIVALAQLIVHWVLNTSSSINATGFLTLL